MKKKYLSKGIINILGFLQTLNLDKMIPIKKIKNIRHARKIGVYSQCLLLLVLLCYRYCNSLCLLCYYYLYFHSLLLLQQSLFIITNVKLNSYFLTHRYTNYFYTIINHITFFFKYSGYFQNCITSILQILICLPCSSKSTFYV